MNKKIRVGILGAGFMGTTHARNLGSIPGVEIVAVCAAVLEEAQKLSLNITQEKAAVFTRFDKMLDDAEMDALVVAIPPFAHSGQVEAAAAKGLHMLIEKPLAIELDRARKMVQAVKKAGVVGQMAYHMRFGHAVQELRKMIASGKAGRPTLFDARYACNSVHGPWWRDKKKSGGQTLEQIIHLYDMAMLMLGKPVRVSGFAANLCHKDVPGYTVEDTSAFSILFKEGGMANISGTNNAVPMKWVNPFTVVCEKLTAFFESPNQAEFVFTADGKAESVVVSGNVNMYQEEAKAFIRVLRGEIENPAPLEQGLLGLKTAAAALESARLKGEVQIIR